jgi:pimeloyl-ACP methyl ester carboxylesterase
VEHIKSHKTFRRWHPEALEAYVNSAIVQTADNRWKLALPPMQEAATFCHEFIQLPAEKLARAKCPLFFEPAERSFFFYPQSARALAEKVGETVVVGEPIPKTSHVMVHEDPDACAQRIAEDLAQLPLFQ